MVTTFYPPYHFGGDATYIRALSKGLANRGHEIEVIHCEDAFRIVNKGGKEGEKIKDKGIQTHRLKSLFGFLSPIYTQQTGRPGFKLKAIRKILDKNFDVVNFHNISLIGGPALLKLSNAPVTLYTLHEHWLLCPTHIFWKNNIRACDKKDCFSCAIRSGKPPQLWRYGKLIENSLKYVDALISPSQFTATKHASAGIKIPIHILKLFSAVTSDPNEKYCPPSRPRFLFAGRVTASKGIIPMLELFSKRKEYDLIVAGDGDLLQHVKKQYASFNNISFLGVLSQENLRNYYQEATALIFPSLAPEVFGLAIVEAFACGTPAIVHKSGGVVELIATTGGGITYDTELELINAMEKLARSESLRQELGEKAREGFEKYYREETHLDNYLSLINDILITKQSKGLLQ